MVVQELFLVEAVPTRTTLAQKYKLHTGQFHQIGSVLPTCYQNIKLQGNSVKENVILIPHQQKTQ